MKSSLFLGILIAFTCNLSKSSTYQVSSLHLALLSGCWKGTVDGAIIEERWDKLSGGLMLGTSKTIVEGDTKEWGFMKIEIREIDIVYTPFLNGIEVKPFHLNSNESNANKIVFENFQNEFPKQIIYTKKANQLGIQLTGDSNVPTIQYDLPNVSCTK